MAGEAPAHTRRYAFADRGRSGALAFSPAERAGVLACGWVVVETPPYSVTIIADIPRDSRASRTSSACSRVANGPMRTR